MPSVEENSKITLYPFTSIKNIHLGDSGMSDDPIMIQQGTINCKTYDNLQPNDNCLTPIFIKEEI